MTITPHMIERARVGDLAATRALVDDLEDMIGEMIAVCAARGWPPAEVMDTVASAIAVAIQTFEQGRATFADFAECCVRRAIRARVSQEDAIIN